MRPTDYYTVALVKRKGSPMTARIPLDTKTPLSILKALALSFARDIDNGEDRTGELRQELERVMALVPTAPEARFQ